MTPDQWTPGAGIRLEPNAERACREANRNVAVIAGPGAGKTELLAQRADFLLRTNTCTYPRRILAISFKVDAAANLGERVRERVPTELATRLDSQTFHGFAHRLIRRFRPVLTGQNELDSDFTIGTQRAFRTQVTFGDLVPLATEILERDPLVLAALRATYSHVFLDEFQDCTRNQYSLIRQAFLGTDTTLTAVGDNKQRIMGWAGALEEIFQDFADDFTAIPFTLYQNFRSWPRLRRMQNRMITVMDPSAAVPEEDLAGDDGQIEILATGDENEEARLTCAWIQRLIRSGIPDSHIAILFAKQPDLYGAALRQTLDSARITYRNEQDLQDLATEPLAKLIVAYLQTLIGAPSPHGYVLLHRSRLLSTGDDEELFGRRDSWNVHVRQVRDWLESSGASLSDRRTLEALASRFRDFFGAPAIAALHPDYDAPARVDEVVKDIIDRVEELLSADGADASSLDKFADEHGVRMMSIHKSKGLEFDAVAVMAVEHEMFWGELDNERAAYFVAISRAKQQLLLTHTKVRQRPPGVRRWNVQRTPHAEFLGYAEERDQMPA